MQSGSSISPGMVQKYGKYFAYQAGKIVDPNFGPRNTSQQLRQLLLKVPPKMFRDFMFDVSTI